MAVIMQLSVITSVPPGPHRWWMLRSRYTSHGPKVAGFGMDAHAAGFRTQVVRCAHLTVRRVQERKKNRRRETTLKRLGMKTPLSTKWPAKHVAKSCWILHHIFLGQNLFSHPNSKQTLTFHLLLPCLQLICVAGFSEVQRCFLTALSPVLGALFVSTGLGVRSWIILIEGKLLVKWGDFFSTSYNLTQKNTYITF